MAVSNSPSSPPRRAVPLSADGSPENSASAKSAVQSRLLPPSGSRLGRPVAAASLWIAALIGLAVWTANPVTLNRAQIAEAPLIVEATLLAGEPPRWQVSRSWPHAELNEPIEIQGLDELPLHRGAAYLIPVERVDRRIYELVRSPGHFKEAFVYPSTPETVADLEAVLQGDAPE